MFVKFKVYKDLTFNNGKIVQIVTPMLLCMFTFFLLLDVVVWLHFTHCNKEIFVTVKMRDES